ncbi:MAG: hypothetical protein KDC39_01925 [Actinobacteria bacterium]|nr:hypothetical protein [Actinomycetota bacterium]
MRSANMRAALGALLHGNREDSTDDGVGSITRDAEVRLADAPDSSAEPVREANSTAYAVAATIASGTERDAARLAREVWVTRQVLLDDELHVHLLVSAFSRSHARSEVHDQLGHLLGRNRVISVIEVADYDAALPELLDREGLLDDEFACFDDGAMVDELLDRLS